MTIRPARHDELVYVRETALKVMQPDGVRWRTWEVRARAWVSELEATVIADGDVLVVGFALEGGGSVQVLYVRRRFRGLGLGELLRRSRPVPISPVAPGIGEWSDIAGA